MPKSDPRYGLVLTLGGAPDTPHQVPGLPGFYRPDIATPVGGEGELPLDAAYDAAAQHDILELIEIPAEEVPAAEETAQQTLVEAREGIAAARASEPQGAEVSVLKDEQDALVGALNPPAPEAPEAPQDETPKDETGASSEEGAK